MKLIMENWEKFLESQVEAASDLQEDNGDDDPEAKTMKQLVDKIAEIYEGVYEGPYAGARLGGSDADDMNDIIAEMKALVSSEEGGEEGADPRAVKVYTVVALTGDGPESDTIKAPNPQVAASKAFARHPSWQNWDLKIHLESDVEGRDAVTVSGLGAVW
jgi:hypothetical protein